MNKIDKIRQLAQGHLDEVRWPHTQDVVKIALILAEKEGADKEIVEIAAWLHDVGSSDKRGGMFTHQIYSIEMAQKLLKGLGFKESKIKRITQCIKEHMGPVNEIMKNWLKKESKDWSFLPRPSTVESKVVYDADMINLCGPFGVVKGIIFRIKEGKSFKDIITEMKMITKQAFGDLKTKSGKELGKKYFSASQEFLKMIKV